MIMKESKKELKMRNEVKEGIKEIRKVVKELGLSNRNVSVRKNRGSIKVEIKDAKALKHANKIEKVAKGQSKIDRDEVTHEILSGGNIFVNFRVKREVYKDFLEQARNAVKELKQSESNTAEIAGLEVFIPEDHPDNLVFFEDTNERVIETQAIEDIAKEMAILDQQEEDEDNEENNEDDSEDHQKTISSMQERIKRDFASIVEENDNVGNAVIYMNQGKYELNSILENSFKLCDLKEASFQRLWDSIGTYDLGSKYIIDTNFNSFIQKIAVVETPNGWLEITRGCLGIGSNSAQDVSAIFYHSEKPTEKDLFLVHSQSNRLFKVQ